MSKMPKDPAVYVWDMLNEIMHVTQFMQNGNIYDPLVSRAVLRSFTVLGEAAKRVDDNTRQMTPDIPWQNIIDTRNYLSHEYEEINLQKTEAIIVDHFPSLEIELKQLYKKLTGEEYQS